MPTPLSTHNTKANLNCWKVSQRRATKLVPGMKNLNYVQRLNKLKLPSLLYRRQRGDMIEAYKYTHGLYNVSPSPIHLDPGTVTRGHAFKMSKLFSSKNIRLKFFSERIVNEWNKLPADTAEAPSLNSFKNRLDKHWINKCYDIPNF